MLSSSSQKQSKKHSWTIKQSRQQFSECTSMIASLGYFTSPALLLTLPELIPCDTSCKRIFNLTANFNFEGMWCFCATGHWWRQQSREVRFSKSFTPCILCHWQCKESSGGCVSRSRLMCWCIGFSLVSLQVGTHLGSPTAHHSKTDCTTSIQPTTLIHQWPHPSLPAWRKSVLPTTTRKMVVSTWILHQLLSTTHTTN